MTRASRVLAATTVISVVASVYLFVENRGLRANLATATTAATARTDGPLPASAVDPDERDAGRRRSASIPFAGGALGPPPMLTDEPKESRAERRARRTQELGDLLGRKDGETEEQWRARIQPMMKLGLAVPRERTAEMRREAEAAAKVTPEQSKQIDEALTKVYDDVLAYTNKAVTDGQLSPYERDVAGWLEYAGGLGTLLGDAESAVGKVLAPDQVRALYDSGFEWGEYLGANAPWENIAAPPPP